MPIHMLLQETNNCIINASYEYPISDFIAVNDHFFGFEDYPLKNIWV